MQDPHHSSPFQTEPGLHFASESLNYGDAKGSSFRFGHPKFLEALAGAVFSGKAMPLGPFPARYA